MIREGKRKMAVSERLREGQRGLTLLEMAVVGAILSILAGLTAVAVTGSSTAASESALTSDLSEVDKAVSSYSGQHPRSEYPTLNGCLPGQTKISGLCATTSSPAPWPTTENPTTVLTWLQSNANWAAIVWNKSYSQAGVTREFGTDFLGRLPRHAKEHADAGFTLWVRNVTDPDNALLSLLVPNCAGAADNHSNCVGAIAANYAPVWVLDKDGVVRVVIPPSSY